MSRDTNTTALWPLKLLIGLTIAFYIGYVLGLGSVAKELLEALNALTIIPENGGY